MKVSGTSLKRRLLAVSWSMPPMVAPRAINVSRILAELAAREWEIEVLAGELPAEERGLYIWDDSLADKYRKFFTVRYLPYDRVAPSGERSWEAVAEEAAVRSIQARPPHVLLTFAQPFSDHAVGLAIKNAFPSLPWIAHFSDPWTDNIYAVPQPRDFKLERGVIEWADAVGFITDRTRDLVMAKYPAAWCGKTFIIPHGYEGEAVSRTSLVPGPLRIVHTGGIYGKRIPYVFLDVLAALRRKGFDALVTFVGPVDQLFRQHADELGSGIVFVPPTTPVEAARYADEADVLLLCDAPAKQSVFLPSKLVEYLPFGLPVLALTPVHGSSADVLRETGGLVVDPDDAAGQTDALRRLAAMKVEGTLLSLAPALAAVKHYAIGETAAIFERILEQYASKDTVPFYKKRFSLKNVFARI